MASSAATPVDLCHIITENTVNSLLNTLLYGERKFLIWTRLCLENSSWIINTSDGVDVWKLEIDGQSLNSYRELSQADTYETFFTKIRSDFLCGHLMIDLQAEKITLTVGATDMALSFDLYEASADDRKNELQILILRMADDIISLTDKLKVSTESLERMKNEKDPAPSSSVFDMPQKKVKAPTVKRKQGYSLVNPGSQNDTVTDLGTDSESLESTVHLSVLTGTQMLDIYRCPDPSQCQFPCGKGSRRYHCPLCDNRPQKPGRMRRHFFLMHAGNHVIEHEGFRILRCKLKCTRANGRITDCSHYHCCLCGRVCLRKVHLCCHLQAHTLGTAKDVEDDMIDTKEEEEPEEEEAEDDDDADADDHDYDHDDTADETVLQTSQMACSIAGESENMVTLADGTQVVYVQSVDNGESALTVVPVSSQSESMQIHSDQLNSSLQVLASSQPNNQMQELGTIAQDVTQQVGGDQDLEAILGQGQSRVVGPSDRVTVRSEPSTGIPSFHTYTSHTEQSQVPSSQPLHFTQSYSELANEQEDPEQDGNVVFEGGSPTRQASHIQKPQDLPTACELANQVPMSVELSGVTNSLDINDLVSNAPVAASQVPSMEGATSSGSPVITSSQMITSDSTNHFQSPSKTITMTSTSESSSQFQSPPFIDGDQSSRTYRGSDNDNLPLLKSDGGPQEDDRVFSKLFGNITPSAENIFQHPSVVPERSGMNVCRCKNTECDCRLYHCPLCTCLPNKPGRIKEHFRKIHAENLIIKYRGYQMLRCKLGCCRPTGRRILNSHYHCFLCGCICISKPGVYEHVRTQHSQGTVKPDTQSNDTPEKRKSTSTSTPVPAKKQVVDPTQLSPTKTKLEETAQNTRPLVVQVPGLQASNNNQRVSLDGQGLDQSGGVATSQQQMTVQLPDVQASPSQQQQQQQQPLVILMPQQSQNYTQGQQQQQQPIVIVMPQGGGAGGVQMAQPIIVPMPQPVNN